MGQPIPAQHPSVVLRSQFNLVRALLAIAMVAVLALSAVVVILANDEDQVSGGAASARPIESINYGGFNPATGRPDAPAVQQQSQTPGARYDGGPEEGSRGATSVQPQTAPGTRFDGGPEEGSRGATSVQPQTAPGTRFDGGPDEGTRGPRSYYESPSARSSYQPAPVDALSGRIGGPR
jgi:hypothetical protein